MSSLKSLTFTALPTPNSSPLLVRRSRLIEKLEDQKSLLKDPAYVRVVQRWKKQDGERMRVEKKLPVHPWWRTDEKGKLIFFVRLGWKPIEFEKGKAGIIAEPMEKLSAVIDTLIEAIRAGELDQVLDRARRENPAPTSRVAKKPGREAA